MRVIGNLDILDHVKSIAYLLLIGVHVIHIASSLSHDCLLTGGHLGVSTFVSISCIVNLAFCQRPASCSITCRMWQSSQRLHYITVNKIWNGWKKIERIASNIQEQTLISDKVCNSQQRKRQTIKSKELLFIEQYVELSTWLKMNWETKVQG